MQFNLARMFAAMGLIAIAVGFLQIAMVNSSAHPSSQPALPVLLPSVSGLAFTLAALGMLFKGVGGAAAGLLTGFALGLPHLVIFVLLDVRFLFQ